MEQPDWKCIQFPVISLVKHKKIRFYLKKITHKKMHASEGKKQQIFDIVFDRRKREEKEFLGKEIESLC